MPWNSRLGVPGYDGLPLTRFMDHPSIDALLLAAGGSRRMGGEGNKVFLSLGPGSVISFPLRMLNSSPLIRALFTAIRPEDENQMAEEIDGCAAAKARARMVIGGRERFHSVRNGLEAIATAGPPDLVLIHDGARPFLDHRLIEASAGAASRFGAAVVGHPMVDTAKETDGGGPNPIALRAPERGNLWQVQTPQAFRFHLILDAYRRWDESGQTPTDDATVAEAAGHPVRLVPGHPYNIKITTQMDLEVARALVAQGVWTPR